MLMPFRVLLDICTTALARKSSKRQKYNSQTIFVDPKEYRDVMFRFLQIFIFQLIICYTIRVFIYIPKLRIKLF